MPPAIAAATATAITKSQSTMRLAMPPVLYTPAGTPADRRDAAAFRSCSETRSSCWRRSYGVLDGIVGEVEQGEIRGVDVAVLSRLHDAADEGRKQRIAFIERLEVRRVPRPVARAR